MYNILINNNNNNLSQCSHDMQEPMAFVLNNKSDTTRICAIIYFQGESYSNVQVTLSN